MPSTLTTSIRTPALLYLARSAFAWSSDADVRHLRRSSAPYLASLRLLRGLFGRGLRCVPAAAAGRVNQLRARTHEDFHRLRAQLEPADAEIDDGLENAIGRPFRLVTEVVRDVQADLHPGDLRVRPLPGARGRGQFRQDSRDGQRREGKLSEFASSVHGAASIARQPRRSAIGAKAARRALAGLERVPPIGYRRRISSGLFARRTPT